MDSEYIARINKMNFRELRDELSLSSNNPVKSLIIRKLMKQKYLKYKKIRDMNIQQQKYKVIHKKQEDEITKMMVNELLDEIEKNNNDTILEVIDDTDMLDETNYDKHGPLNELDPSAKLFDNKFVDEIQRDHMNNNLMNRMNSDIHIQEIRRNKLKNFETPFSDTPNDRYAPFHNDPTIIPSKDFTAKSRFT